MAFWMHIEPAHQTAWAILAGAICLLALSVFILARLRWIQSRPISTCIVLSVVAHLLLIGAAHFMHLYDLPSGAHDQPTVIRLQDAFDAESKAAEVTRALDRLATDPVPLAQFTPVPALDWALPPREPDDELPRHAPDTALADEVPVQVPPPDDAAQHDPTPPPAAVDVPLLDQEASSAPFAPAPLAPQPLSSQETPLEADSANAVAADLPAVSGDAAPRGDMRPVEQPSPTLPTPYRGRVGDDRLALLRLRGGDDETEAAVQRALEWLARHQQPDGHWNAAAHGAGRGATVEGTFRGAAGIHADTGVTGLALLAFLGAGETHLQGQHKTTVARGLEYLLHQQGADGNLGGPATYYARMYCHGMATFALAEAMAMSQDERLRPFLERAVQHTLAGQHPETGGWRYYPGDTGDTSQLGWQVMALHSAEWAGIPVPPATWARVRRFLDSVASGRHGGRAAYRPGHAVTPVMTAEALTCHLILGQLQPERLGEAVDFLGQQLPGDGPPNLYYWYYASLALSRTENPLWSRWNDALRSELKALQEPPTAGDQEGSFRPQTVWSGHGGRVYTTALGCLCLESYYR